VRKANTKRETIVRGRRRNRLLRDCRGVPRISRRDCGPDFYRRRLMTPNRDRHDRIEREDVRHPDRV
jgi:hypothetical protein